VAVQWPEGFRLDPNARWDDEIKRLSEAAGAFERFAKVVQSTLLECRSRWSNCLEFSPPGTSNCPPRLRRLIGGLVGAAIASASTVDWMTGVVGKVIVPMILAPFVGFVGGHC
jgi:hypothetical protein